MLRKQFTRFVSSFGPRHLVARAVPEVLEKRRMFDVTASIVSNVLVVQGTSSADDITVFEEDTFPTDEVKVHVVGQAGGDLGPFLVNQFNSVKIQGSGGDDSLVVEGTGNLNYGNLVVGKAAEILGEDGNDTIRGGDSADTLTGGNGNDTFVANANPDGGDVMNGNAGTDTADYQNRSAALKVSIDGIADDGALDANPGLSGNQSEADNVKTDIEILYGGDGDDSLNGSGSNDTINGKGGNDVMYGGFGDDDLTGGSGVDIMYGNEGNDTFHSDDGGFADSVFGGSGSDTAADFDGADFLQL